MKILDSHDESGDLLIENDGRQYVRDEDGNWFVPQRWKYGDRKSVYPHALEERFLEIKEEQLSQ